MAKEERYVKKVQTEQDRIAMVKRKIDEDRKMKEIQKNSGLTSGPKDKLQEMKMAETMKQIEAKNKKSEIIEQQKKARATEVQKWI